jgi:hypothetical protein
LPLFTCFALTCLYSLVLQYLSACVDKLRELLLESSQRGLVDALQDVRGIVFGAPGLPTWNHALDAAKMEFFHGADDVDPETIDRVRRAIASGLTKIPSELLADNEASKKMLEFIGRFITEALQGVLQSCGPNIGGLVVEAVRCSKDASR